MMSFGVLSSPSMWIPGQLALYPTRSFSAGDVVLHATSPKGRWEEVSFDARFPRPAHTIEAFLKNPYATKIDRIVLQGSLADPWVYMNSSRELLVKPNVLVKVAGGVAGDDFLLFVAAEDIAPFQGELLWDYEPYVSGFDADAAVATEDATADNEPLPAPNAAADKAEDDESGPAAAAPPKSAADPSPLPGASAPPEFVADAQEPVLTKDKVQDSESLEKHATLLTDALKPDAKLYAHLRADQAADLFLTFAKPQAQVKPQILYTIVGGAVVSDRSYAKVPYQLTLKTKIVVGGETMTVAEALGKTTKKVWGYKDRRRHYINCTTAVLIVLSFYL